MGSLRQSQIWSEELKTNFGVATGYLRFLSSNICHFPDERISVIESLRV